MSILELQGVTDDTAKVARACEQVFAILDELPKTEAVGALINVLAIHVCIRRDEMGADAEAVLEIIRYIATHTALAVAKNPTSITQQVTEH